MCQWIDPERQTPEIKENYQSDLVLCYVGEFGQEPAYCLCRYHSVKKFYLDLASYNLDVYMQPQEVRSWMPIREPLPYKRYVQERLI